MRAEFDESLVTGNEMIDGQHKELIQKINDLLDSCEENGGKAAAVRMLNFLADIQNFIFRQRKNCRRRLHILELKSTRKSTKSLSVQWKSCTRCWRKRKGLPRHLWSR